MSVEMFKDKRVMGLLAVSIVLLLLVWLWPPIDILWRVIGSLVIVANIIFWLWILKAGKPVSTAAKPKETPEPTPTPDADEDDEHTEMHIPEVVEPSALLSDLPIETIEGIGHVYGEELRSAGIVTVQDLLVADSAEIARVCDVPETQAKRWIAMGRFAWVEGISEEDAEAIVFATGITGLKQLAEANPEDLLAKVLKAVEDGSVEVPGDYKFTIDMVRGWIDGAREAMQ